VLHRSVGLIMLATMLLRAGWRWRHPAPPLPVGLAPLEVALARCTHVLLYLIFIGMPIAGLVNAVAAGHSVSLFGVVSIRPLLPENDRLSRLAIALHLVRQYLIYFFVTLHVAGALLHARPPRRSAQADAAASPLRLSRSCLRQKIAPPLALSSSRP
jgi:cytochrome b561